MTPKAYFLMALRKRWYKNRTWVIDSFSVSDTGNPPDEEGAIFRDKTGVRFYDGTEWVGIEGVKVDEPILRFRDPLSLDANTLANQKTDVDTTYGRALLNQLVLCEPFGDRIPFINDEISASKIERLIHTKLKDDAEAGPTDISVSQYLRFADIASSLAGYSPLCVPSATPRSMTTDPNLIKKRDEMVKAAGDSINDPVVQARIDAELVAMDKAWIKGDDAEGFYISGKSYDKTRKLLYINQGSPSGFGVQGEFIASSLREGWKTHDIPSMSNSMREGSYSRGKQTADGGVTTKFNYRIFQNATIAEDDCGSRLGIPITITPEEANFYLSSSIVTPTGTIELTTENINQYVGKPVLLRSPGYCKTAGANYCLTCYGKQYRDLPNALGVGAASIGSAFLAASLARFHGTVNTLVNFDVNDIIR